MERIKDKINAIAKKSIAYRAKNNSKKKVYKGLKQNFTTSRSTESNQTF